MRTNARRRTGGGAIAALVATLCCSVQAAFGEGFRLSPFSIATDQTFTVEETVAMHLHTDASMVDAGPHVERPEVPGSDVEIRTSVVRTVNIVELEDGAPTKLQIRYESAHSTPANAEATPDLEKLVGSKYECTSSAEGLTIKQSDGQSPPDRTSALVRHDCESIVARFGLPAFPQGADIQVGERVLLSPAQAAILFGGFRSNDVVKATLVYNGPGDNGDGLFDAELLVDLPVEQGAGPLLLKGQLRLSRDGRIFQLSAQGHSESKEPLSVDSGVVEARGTLTIDASRKVAM